MIPETTVAGLLHRAALEFPDRPAVVFPDERSSYRDLWVRAEGWARRLLALGVQQGEHVGLIMINSMDFIDLLFGIAASGAVAVPINPRYRSSELKYVIDNSDVSTIVVCERVSDELDLVDRLIEALPELSVAGDPTALQLAGVPTLKRVVFLGDETPAGFVGVNDLLAPASAVDPALVMERCEQTAIRDVAMLMYTSGTTDRPKGAMLSHESLVRVSSELGLDRYSLTPEDRVWDPLPLFHMAGILPMLAAFRAGAAFLCMPRVEAPAGLAMIRTEQATVGFIAFASLAISMIDMPGFKAEDLSSLRIIHTNGPADLLQRIQSAVPSAVQANPYGCTEAGGLVSTSEVTDSPDQRATYSGRPYRGIQVRIVDPVNCPLAPGESGEIVVRGYSLFNGYFRNPEATQRAVDPDGWFHTGDLGQMDSDGRIRYVARIKDMLKVGGENVAAIEIEALLMRHAAVRTAAVVGVPDDRLDEVPVAFVELSPGAVATSEELIRYCAGEIASFKVPRRVLFVTTWPMSSTKIQKFKLRETLDAGTTGQWA